MTSEEKAKDLVRICGIANAEHVGVDGIVTNHDNAKKSALIVVNEILRNFGALCDGAQFYTSSNAITYYEQVKQEIQKL
jgi:nicotinamide mononucleotide (NMN) deamidase PncC